MGRLGWNKNLITTIEVEHRALFSLASIVVNSSIKDASGNTYMVFPRVAKGATEAIDAQFGDEWFPVAIRSITKKGSVDVYWLDKKGKKTGEWSKNIPLSEIRPGKTKPYSVGFDLSLWNNLDAYSPPPRPTW